jgi:hypothetical protein
MENVSRRGLLRNGSFAVMGVGLVGAVSAGVASKAPDASAAERSPEAAAESAALPSGASLDGPLVAHVKDLRTGEIGVYLGTTEVTFRDPHLAAKLYRAVG